MFRLVCAVLVATVCGSAFAQNFEFFRDMERSWEWDRFGDRSRSRFSPAIFGGDSLDHLESEMFQQPKRNRLGEATSRDAGQHHVPSTATRPNTAPSANTPIPADIAETPRVPNRRPTGFSQQPGVLEPNFVLDEPATPREQRWFRDSDGGRRGGPTVGHPEPGIGRGATALGGEDMFRSVPNAGTAPLRTPMAPPQNPELTRQKYEEKLEGMLLSNPSVHLLSPVRISFSGGVATVRGVVPNQTHKVAAGNILLSDPSVKQVNNMMTVIPLDPNNNPPPIEGR